MSSDETTKCIQSGRYCKYKGRPLERRRFVQLSLEWTGFSLFGYIWVGAVSFQNWKIVLILSFCIHLQICLILTKPPGSKKERNGQLYLDRVVAFLRRSEILENRYWFQPAFLLNSIYSPKLRFLSTPCQREAPLIFSYVLLSFCNCN